MGYASGAGAQAGGGAEKVMRAVPGDSHRWTRRQWILSVLGVLAFQVAVIWIAGEPPVRSPALPTNDMRLHLTADRWAA